MTLEQKYDRMERIAHLLISAADRQARKLRGEIRELRKRFGQREAQQLNIKSEVHHVAFLHYVVLAFQSQ